MVTDTTPAQSHGDHAAMGVDRHIVRGITVGFLISVATLPFGYLITLILAKVSAEAVGTFRILGIYLSIVSSILYFGGGTVTIHFIAELPREKRLSFFFTYFVLTLAMVALGLISLTLFPSFIRSLFGSNVNMHFLLLLLLCAPLPLFWFAALATLRGLMLVAFAQALMRLLTPGICLIYGYLFIFHKDLFQREYISIIIIPYFLLLGIMSILAFRRMKKEIATSWSDLTWLLPQKFWRFSLAVQIPSMLALMQQRGDEIFLLRALGISQLGIYSVLLQLAEASLLLSNFFLDGLFPAIVNLRATERLDKIVGLYQDVARYILLISAGITYSLFAFSRPLLSLFGDQYAGAIASFTVFLLFTSLDSLGPLNHTLIVGLKKMNYWTSVQFIRLVGFLLLFPLLAHSLGLMGVIVARGVAWSCAGGVAYWIVLRKLPLKPRIPRQYVLHVGLSCVLGMLCYLRPKIVSTWGWNLFLFLGAFTIFFVFGGYRLAELQQFRQFYVTKQMREAE